MIDRIERQKLELERLEAERERILLERERERMEFEREEHRRSLALLKYCHCYHIYTCQTTNITLL